MPDRSTRRTTAYSATWAKTGSRSHCRRSLAAVYDRPEWASPGKASRRLRPPALGYSSRRMGSMRSRCRWSSAGVAQSHGSAQRLPVPCDRSTTPFMSGRQGGLKSRPTPRPSSHRPRSVGRSPDEPHGPPLSRRNEPGSPQRPKPRRSSSRTAAGSTSAQYPGGKNPGPQRRPAALIDDPQPTTPPAALQGDALAGVHLPDLVGAHGSGRLGGGGPPPFGGRPQPGLMEPALERPLGRQVGPGVVVPQQDADQPPTPGGVGAAEGQGLFPQRV